MRTSPMQRRRRAVVLLSILLGFAAFQGWVVDFRWSNVAHRRSSEDLADSYTAGLAQGHAYLVGTPMEAGSASGQDISGFKGQNYIYYGIAPFALLLVPWLWLTGSFLSSASCILLGLFGGYLAYGCALWLLFRDDGRPGVDGFLPAGYLAVVIGSGTWPLLAVARINEMESAFGYAALGAAVLGLVLALQGGRGRKWALGGAMFFGGLAVACRPNCLPAVAVIAGAAGYRAWRAEGTTGQGIKAALICSAPLVAIAVGLAGWNYVRFGSILEFGQSYGTGAMEHPAYAHFSRENVVYNLHRYLAGRANLAGYFPFIEGVREGPVPLPSATHEHVDQIYGSWILFPVLIGAAGAFRRNRRGLGTVLVIASAGNLLLLCGLGFGSYRYAPDYLGLLAFASGLGICAAAPMASPTGRRLVAAAVGSLLLWSGAAGLCELASISRATHPLTFARLPVLARLTGPIDRLTYRLEEALHAGPATIRITALLPRDQFGRDEPLLVSGEPGLEDFVYLRYPEPGRLQVGFESIGHGGPVTAPFPIDYGRPHVFDISLGSLLPPDDHPLLKSRSPGDVLLARGFVHIAIDGEPVLEGAAELHPTRSRLFWGASPDDPAFGRRFSGRLLRIERPRLREVGVYPQWDHAMFGPIAIVVKLNPAGATTTAQPLVSIGYRPRGAMLLLERMAPDRIRLQWVVGRQAAVLSPPIAWLYAREHTLELAAGPLLPPESSSVWGPAVPPETREERKRVLRCTVDGREVWRLDMAAPDAAPSSVRVGENGLSRPEVADVLDGHIISWSRGAW